MQLDGTTSWMMKIDRWAELLDMALWFRAAERIDVPAAGVVPGPLDAELSADPTADPADAAELAAGWQAWWRTVVLTVSDPGDLTLARSFSPPDFTGLREWPALSRVVAGRWEAAARWHNTRKRTGLRAGLHHDPRMNTVVTEVEQELGRKARPFALDLVVVPVRDDEIRLVAPGRYLVPERVYDSPDWPGILRSLVVPVA